MSAKGDGTEVEELEKSLSALGKRLQGLTRDLDAAGDWGQVSGDLSAAVLRLKAGVGGNPDTIHRSVLLGGKDGVRAHIVYYEGLVDISVLTQAVLPALLKLPPEALSDLPSGQRHKALLEGYLPVGSVKAETRWAKVMEGLAGGNLALLIADDPHILLLDLSKVPHRAIDEPETEQTIAGSKDGFSDLLIENIALIRKRIAAPSLRLQIVTLGRLTRTKVGILWIHGVVNRRLLFLAKVRVRSFNGAAFAAASDLRTVLEDHPYSLFPQSRVTERVDETVRALTMGKIAFLVDGTPTASIVPATLVDFYQTAQDYIVPFWDASLIRLIRFVGWLISLYLPAFYVAVTSVNTDLIPTKLLLSLAGAHEGVPFTPLVEVLIMFIVIEILREAALRLPKSLSQTLGTVGAIVVGTAMTKAGIVSSTMIIVVTMTALATFTVPAFEMTVPWRILLWVMVLCANVLGLMGIFLATVALLSHLVSLTSLGVPYLAPFGPFRGRDLKDSILRFPVSSLRLRPQSIRSPAPRQGPRPGRPAFGEGDGR